MARPKFVQIPAHPLERFEPLVGERYAEIEAAARAGREFFHGRALWHFSSTLRGGGVAEMLHSLLPYVRGAGIDTRWVVLRERADFFGLTKRIHNNLHGVPGDGGPLAEGEHALYEQSLAASGRYLSGLVRPGDVVFLHDPQTAGLAGQANAAGAAVVWRCHIGIDEPNAVAVRAQDFLRRYLQVADALVFSRPQYIWQGLDHGRAWAMPPSIDPFSPKNQDMDADTVGAILTAISVRDHSPRVAPVFVRADGTPGRVERSAEVLQEERVPDDAKLVVQVSRWDRLKDHRGVLDCFERFFAEGEVHLLLAGPKSAAISDDPEGPAVWEEVRSAWRALPDGVRRRVHLANLPLADMEENGAIVNAIQRRADVVLQKSLAEGFGLTVSEAMWKSRPVIGARVGGIQDQIVDGVSGVLVDPRDHAQLAREVEAILADPARAAALGQAAHERVREHFLCVTRLAEYSARFAMLKQAVGET
jgi:trehalose synthase